MRAMRLRRRGAIGGRGFGLRDALLLLSAVAFLAQTFSWAARVPARPAVEAVEICAAHGPDVVLLDADGAPVEKPKGGPAHDCPLCPLIAGLSVAPAWGDAPAAPQATVAPAAFAVETSLPRSGPPSDRWARGPPVA